MHIGEEVDTIRKSWRTFQEAMKDEEYAWSWQCNLAMPIMDAIGCTHEQANVAAAHLMQHLWGHDITTHRYYEWPKSAAQAHAEVRIAAEQDEDAKAPSK
jgi:hypothetical protein